MERRSDDPTLRRASKMNTRPRLLAVCVLALSCLVAACGQSTGASNLTVPQDEKLYVFDGSSSDAMRLLVFHPGGGALLTLPGGVVSQDHTRLYHTATSGDRTTITLYDTRSGATTRAFDIAGSTLPRRQDSPTPRSRRMGAGWRCARRKRRMDRASSSSWTRTLASWSKTSPCQVISSWTRSRPLARWSI
jgi:hypothetical protein